MVAVVSVVVEWSMSMGSACTRGVSAVMEVLA
jgi:hypothetical protein